MDLGGELRWTMSARTLPIPRRFGFGAETDDAGQGHRWGNGGLGAPEHP